MREVKRQMTKKVAANITSGNDVWTEKKKKDELLEDTKEYKMIQQHMDAFNNDISMVVVSMDGSADYIHSKSRKLYPTALPSFVILFSFYSYSF